MREKKDAMILEMALRQKKKVEQAKKGSSSSSSYSSGGFVGINQLASKTNIIFFSNVITLKNVILEGAGPKWVPNKKKQQVSNLSDTEIGAKKLLPLVQHSWAQIKILCSF